ncbi:nuclear transport factor 2 family protein [Asanoa sp. NPDC049518]|uniref:nuclear transport factor 2 family protein n=1 Tax=unclassified Asanoa TaxID=2685164 RepID=UPI00341CB09F
MTTTEQVLDQFMERLAKQDADGLGELFADEIDWYVPGSDDLPWTGTRSRRAEVPEYFRTMWPAFVSGQSTAAERSVVIDGDNAALFSRFAHTVAAAGRRFETPVAFHFTSSAGKSAACTCTRTRSRSATPSAPEPFNGRELGRNGTHERVATDLRSSGPDRIAVPASWLASAPPTRPRRAYLRKKGSHDVEPAISDERRPLGPRSHTRGPRPPHRGVSGGRPTESE